MNRTLLWDGLGPAAAIVALLLALAVAALAVYLRPLTRRAVVAFGALWAKALGRSRAGIPWREAIALFLFLGAIGSLAAGIAGPRIALRAPRRIAVVLDASASMDARDAQGRRRFDLARIAAAKVARSARKGDAVSIFRVSSAIRTISPWELATAEPDDASADFAAASAVADAFLAAGSAQAERFVVVLSDSPEAFLAPAGGFREDTSVERVSIGETAENLAVLSFGASSGVASEGGVDLRVTVANAGASEATSTLVLHTGTFRLGSVALRIPAGATETRAFHVAGLPPGASGHEVWASLDGTVFKSGNHDALARDDRRGAWAPDRGTLDVAVVSKRRNRFLDGALAVQGGVRARFLTPVQATPGALQGADVVILDGLDLATGAAFDNALRAGRGSAPGPGGVLRMGPDGEGKALVAPALTDWNGEHPATRKVSLDDLTLAKARVLTTKPGDIVLAATESGPIGLARADGGRRTIHLGFDPTDSDFPLRLGFPVFVGSAVRWLAGADGDLPPVAGRAGHAIPLPGVASNARIARATISPFDGGKTSTSAKLVSRGGTVELASAEAGLYAIDAPGGRTYVELGIDPVEHVLGVADSTPSPRLPEWVSDAENDDGLSLTSLLFACAAILLTLKALFG